MSEGKKPETLSEALGISYERNEEVVQVLVGLAKRLNNRHEILIEILNEFKTPSELSLALYHYGYWQGAADTLF